MQISVNTSDLVKQLQEIKDSTTRKMKSMVAGFAENVTRSALENTPLGEEGRYDGLYEIRQNRWGIDPEPGFHGGAWRYDPDGNFVFDNNIRTPEQAIGQSSQDIRQNFKIGDTFYIGAKGPAYAGLESGNLSPIKAPSGIMKPALDQLMTIYQADLQAFYRRG